MRILHLYPIRKRWDWLRAIGNTRHWLDFHVLLGLSAPLIIAFHSSFKFRGIAGMAFWIMSAVALSGIAGRYLYAQIPRSLSAAELSLKDVEDLLAECGAGYAAFVCEDLTLPSERVCRVDLAQLRRGGFSQRSVVVIAKEELIA